MSADNEGGSSVEVKDMRRRRVRRFAYRQRERKARSRTGKEGNEDRQDKVDEEKSFVQPRIYMGGRWRLMPKPGADGKSNTPVLTAVIDLPIGQGRCLGFRDGNFFFTTSADL